MQLNWDNKYIGIDVAPNQELFVEILNSLNLTKEYEKYKLKYLDHITLYYFGDKPDKIKLEKYIKVLNTEIKFQVKDIVIAENKLMVFSVDLGENNILCDSNLPHITVSTLNSTVKPAESMNVLKEKDKNKIIRIDTPIELYGKVKLYV